MDKLLEIFVRGLIRKGDLEVEMASGRKFQAGDGTAPRAGVRFTNRAAELRLLRNPELGFGEIFMDGRLIVTRGTLFDVLMIVAGSIRGAASSGWLSLLQKTRTLMRRIDQRNNLRRAARNVSHHYDIDSRFYELFLDSDWQYSCAYFEHPGESLEDAQLAKKRHIAAKLLVEPGQTVLDIGCGWGGLGVYLAKFCGVSVTGVTLSEEQLGVAKGRVRDAGLDQRIDFRLQDYRAVPEKFDRIVSVGMFEHVGIGYYEAFFQKVASALSENGVALIHTIGRPDVPIAANPFIAKYVFPGGYIPSLSDVLPSIERAGLTVSDIEILRLHYAETLKAWRERFMARRNEALTLYDERFCRMWEYYLASSEASFRVGDCEVFQIQLCKKVDTVPLTRDYIADRERELRVLETVAPRMRLAGE
jgi:cyclopropane-fatty-acyl-phospholipid synthase